MQIASIVFTALASFVGAWLAARFALSRYYKEKIWERKAAAFTAIFEALHYIGRWYEKNYDAVQVQREMSDDESSNLKSEANKAEAELERRLASETWLIPKSCRSRLETLTNELKNGKHDSWQQFLDAGCFSISSAIKDLRDLVQKDLGINE